jgi:cysteine desulfuration protein SufE
MVKALAAVLCELYSDVTPAEVIAVEPQLWQQCQFTKILSPTRLNGLANVRRLIREKATAWL